jgi:hypothetical protein
MILTIFTFRVFVFSPVEAERRSRLRGRAEAPAKAGAFVIKEISFGALARPHFILEDLRSNS